MRLRVAVAALLALGACALATAPRPARAAFKNVRVGEPPPAFAMRDLEGRPWESKANLGGGVAVVVFWATWSPRSREILEDLERLRAELGPERLRLVAINAEHLAIGDADRAAIRALVAETHSTATVLLDEGLEAFNAFGTMAVPSSLVIDTGGRVSFVLAGYPTTMRSDLADAVRKALGLPTSAELRPVPEYVPKNRALMFYNFGKLLLQKGQDEKALEQFKLAAERDPDYKKPLLEIGLLDQRAGRSEQALAAFTRVRELDPHDPEAAYQAAVSNLRANRLEEAAGIFRELSEEYPDRGGYVLALAVTRKFLGREEEYRAGVAKARELLPPPPRMLYNLGVVAEKRGLLPSAAELLRQALETSLR